MKLRNLGPGLLYAGAAVGVSHLVQSTQAGAGFGLSLVWVIVIANIIKYPFFEFGPRYAAASGESLIEGYRRTWKGAPLLVFILMTLATMFIIQAAVTIVTGGLASYLVTFAGADTLMVADFDLGRILWGKTVVDGKMVIDPVAFSGRILLLCGVILAVGKYKLLDKLMKVIILLLTLTTITALLAALAKGGIRSGEGFTWAHWGDPEMVLAWIVPLVGWMPAPLDIAVWHSVWTLDKDASEKEKISLKTSLLDFKIGYWGTTLLALGFLTLGALVIFGTGVEIQRTAGAFAKQLIDMYAAALGEWARPIIAIAAFTTMLSTTLTVLDGFSRVLDRSTKLLRKETSNNAFGGAVKGSEKEVERKVDLKLFYMLWILVVSVGAFLLLLYAMTNMKQMVNLATTISFVTAPVLATFSYLAVTGPQMPPEHQPKGLLKGLAIGGQIFLYAFAVYYLIMAY